MNSITRIILRGVLSGNVTLTPQVLGALKSVSQDHPDLAEPHAVPNESGRSPDASIGETPRTEQSLAFLSPPARCWIRRASRILGCMFMLAAGPVRAELITGTFEQAKEASTQGRYSEAVRGYESILAQQGWSAPVLFNLANAQQREGEFGRAILNYERAALLSPGDPGIAANLHLARQKAGLAEEPQSNLDRLTHLLSLNGWFCFAAIALFLLAVLLLLKTLWPGMQQALNWGSLPAVFALVLAITAMAIQCPGLNRAVVTASEAVAAVSPVTMAQPVFTLRAGESVTWKQAHGTFALVGNRAGRDGWVKASEVARIIPPPRTVAVPRS